MTTRPATADQIADRIAAVAASFEFDLPTAPARPGWERRNAELKEFIADTLAPQLRAAQAAERATAA
ncbi:hypothetical protein [Pseudonocardia sp. NPDC049635]|uniref:hypothetical protein n=1 Tax=Pseudonocardia sp. NPDC049635 TaxID=3155506 RepID=UPI0033EDB284